MAATLVIRGCELHILSSGVLRVDRAGVTIGTVIRAVGESDATSWVAEDAAGVVLPGWYGSFVDAVAAIADAA